MDEFKQEWKKEPFCEDFKYKLDVDTLQGKCDLHSLNNVRTPTECCKLCRPFRGGQCQGFTFYKGSCFLKSCGAESRAHAGVKKSGSEKVMMTSTTSFIPRQASGAVSAFLLD